MELLKDDDKLKQKCSEVTDFENIEYYQNLIKEMTEICIREYAYASAAPQFGIFKRFILIMTVEEMKAESKQELEAREINYVITPYFNPKITKMMGKQVFYEACMSVDNVVGKVERPYYIEFEAQDINGNVIHKSAEGLEAIIVCHEIDHLDGIEFTDKALDLYYGVDDDERLRIRNKFPHQVVSKTGEFLQDNIKESAKTLLYK